MAPINFDRAAEFIAAVPSGRWTAFKDVAEAGGNARGAQAVGSWLARRGHEVENVHRVLNADGFVPDGWRPAGPGVPADAERVRTVLEVEGVRIDQSGRAAAEQRFIVADWT